MSEPPYWPPPPDWQPDPASPGGSARLPRAPKASPTTVGAGEVVLAMGGVGGLFLVPLFVWATGLGLDGVTTLRGMLGAYGFMLFISLGGSLALLAPAMAVSRGWRVGAGLIVLVYVVPVGLHNVWPIRHFFDDDLHLLVVEIGALPAAVGLLLLASSVVWPRARLGAAS